MGDELNPAGDNAENTIEVENTTEVENQSESGGGENQGHPAWSEYVNELPEQFRPRAQEFLTEFDTKNNSRVERVQQQYAPYQELVEAQVSMDDVKTRFALFNEIERDPVGIAKQLLQMNGYDPSILDKPQDGSQGQENLIEESQQNDPRYTELQNQLKTMQDFIVQKQQYEEQQTQKQQEEQEERELQQAVNTELAGLKKQYGEFDSNWIVMMAITDSQVTGQPVDITKTFEKFKGMQTEAIRNSSNFTAPTVFGGNGGLPSNQVDIGAMSEADFNKYVAEKAQQKQIR